MIIGNHKTDLSSHLKKLALSFVTSNKKGDLSCYGQLIEAQKLSTKDVLLIQKEKLIDLLVYANRFVPYYRNIFDNTNIINKAGEVNFGEFNSIPLLSREILYDNFDNLQSDNISSMEWYHNSSGGSTGIPVKIIQDLNYANWRNAVKILFDHWAHFFPGDKKVHLWGSERDLFVGSETLRIKFRRWLRNIVVMNAFLMTPSKMRKYVEEINHFKPVLIHAYAESLYELSRFIAKENLPVFSPQSIITSAGTLFPEMRKQIEEVFKTSVFNSYGSREVGDIACECDMHDGLHISPLTHYVEIIDKDGTSASPGTFGEIVVTCLTNYSMPLIRYKIGDMGMWYNKDCPCGINWPLLANVSGRVTDTFIRSDGSIVSPEYMIHLIGVVLNKGWIKKFQVVQENYLTISIKIVVNTMEDDPFNLYSSEIAEVSDKIRLVMGEKCSINFTFLDDIPPTPSGKYRYVVSNVERP